ILRGGTFPGSSKIQFASSLLISPTWPSFGLTKTAKSSEPSPLKSPTINAGLREKSGDATFRKTRDTAFLTSSGFTGEAASALPDGVGLSCLSGGVNAGAALTGVGSDDWFACACGG